MNVEDNWYFLRVIKSLIVIIEHPVMRMFCFVFFQIFHFFFCSSLDCLCFTETGGWDLFSNSCCFVKYDMICHLTNVVAILIMMVRFLENVFGKEEKCCFMLLRLW